jgi:four helix bundle protein
MGRWGDGERDAVKKRYEMAKKIRTHRDLVVYNSAFEAAMVLYGLSKAFPSEERYSLTDQMRKSSRSVCANFGEAWRKRRYPAAFISKLSDAEAEAGETQVWIEFAVRCGYMKRAEAVTLYRKYNEVISMIVGMMNKPNAWALPTPRTKRP